MRIYVSHPIRGVQPNPSDAYILRNNLKAQIFGAALRVRYPEHDFYVPADHDELVLIAWKRGHLQAKHVLEADCEIITRRDGVIFYKHEPEYSGGMKIELHHVCCIRKPMAIITDVNEVVDLPPLEELFYADD